MALEILSRLRRSGCKSRLEKSESRSDAAICSALLAPDALHSAFPSDFAYVSGGCWFEKREETAITSQITRNRFCTSCSCWTRHGSRDSAHRKEKHNATIVTDLVMSRGLESVHCDGMCCYLIMERRPHSRHSHCQTWLGRASPDAIGDLDLYSVYASYRGPDDDRVDAERASEFELDALEGADLVRDLKTEGVTHFMRVSGEDDEARKSDTRINTDSGLHASRSASALSDVSADTVSVAASSTVLNPTMMPRIVCEETTGNGGSDHGSLESASTYSVEADEMIDVHHQVWKYLARDAWKRARLKRKSKSQNKDVSRFSFTT